MTIYITPFGRLPRRRMIERMMDPDWNQATASELYFPIDVKAEDDGYTLTALLPGVHPEDLNVQVVNETVTIQGESKLTVDEKASYLLREIPSGSFSRTITLPMPLDSNGAEAHFEHGVLTLRVPKAEAVRPRTIKVVAR